MSGADDKVGAQGGGEAGGLLRTLGRLVLRALPWREDELRAAQEARAQLLALRSEMERCRRVENELRASEARFRLALDVAPVGMAVVALDGRFLQVNRAMCDLVGYREQELLRSNWQALTRADDLDRDLARMKELLAGRISHYEIEKHYVRKDGGERLVSVGVSLARNVDDSPWFLVCRVIDVTEQRRLEAELAERERRFRGLFDAALDPMLISDDRFRFVDINMAACELLGLPRERVIGHRLDSLRRRLLDFDVRAAWRRLQAEGTLLGEFRIRDGEGRVRVLEYAARANFLPQRDLAVFRDVTARVQTEQALRERERQLAEAQAIAHVGHWELDLETGRVYGSAEGFRIYGWPPDKGWVTREELMQVIHPDDLPRVRQALRNAWATEGTFAVDHRITRLDGAPRLVQSRGEATRLAGNGVRVLGVVQDITDAHRAQQERERLVAELSAERRWLDTLIERSPVAILLVDGTGRMRANERAHQLLGFIPEGADPEGLLPRICNHDGTAMPRERMPLVRALRGETIQAEETCFLQGERMIVTLVSAGPIRDEEGRHLGAVAVFEDLTRLKELERLREEWTSVVAHDLRQPVTVIHAQAQLLARKARDLVELAGKVDHIVAAARQLDHMIGDLLDVSRIEARRLALERQPLEMASFATAVVERMAGELEGHEVRVVASGPLPLVAADPVRVEQIFGNLLSNAAKYGRPGGPITIDLRHENSEVSARVINEGRGLEPDEIGSLFTRFYRARSAREQQVAGLGLGLYITRGLVEAHGGTIRASSEPGRTTTFCFSLPVA